MRMHPFFSPERERELNQGILDTLVLDLEFDPDREESTNGALLDAAKSHNLEARRLQEVIDFEAQVPQRDDHRSWNWVNGGHDVTPAPDWAALFTGIDLHTPEGVDEAITRRRSTEGPLHWDEFLAHMRGAVEPAHRPEHLLALVHSQELTISMMLDALEACANAPTPTLESHG